MFFQKYLPLQNLIFEIPGEDKSLREKYPLCKNAHLLKKRCQSQVFLYNPRKIGFRILQSDMKSELIILRKYILAELCYVKSYEATLFCN